MLPTDKEVLGKVCSVIDCEHKTAPSQDEGVPLIRTPNIGVGHLILDNAKKVSDKTYAAWTRRARPEPGDLIMAREAPVGNVALIRKGQRVCLGQRTVLLRLKDKKTSSYYLNYLLNSPAVNTYLNLLANGATVEHLNVADIRKLALPKFPSRAAQDKIAAVLSAYDDLIEDNRRRIALLEKMAEETYREWFVRMRFPGHGQANFERRVPTGWECDVASKFFGHVKGKSYTGDELTDSPEDMPFITLKSFNRGGGYRADGLKHYSGKYKEEQVVKRGDVVMAVTDMTQNREVVGRAARIPQIGEKGAAISLDVIKLTPRTVSASFLYSYMRLSGFGQFIKEFANGTNVLHLKPELVTRQKIIVPTKELRERFDGIVDPIYDQIDSLSEVVDHLSASRDALLPRLISGRLDLENLEIRFPPSMLTDIEVQEPQAAHA